MTPKEAQRVEARRKRWQREAEEQQVRAEKTMTLDEEPQIQRRSRDDFQTFPYTYTPDELPTLSEMLTFIVRTYNTLTKSRYTKRSMLQDIAGFCSVTGLTPHELVYRQFRHLHLSLVPREKINQS